jgi:PPK2 family polyphosphate:nucleotide phosphotransferase
MDTSGKDGTIRHVFEGVNPQGVRVSSFKVPTPAEAAHDFLWRVHLEVPRRGEIAIFNRSHYEDVLVTRVHHLVPRTVWSQRYHAINQFEKELVEEGVSVVKFFLHISREEQQRRLTERLEDRTKRWKLSPSDFQERRFWPRYLECYEEMLRRTSTPWAPWFAIPSDHKWFRNLAVSTVLTEKLAGMDLRYPEPKVNASFLSIA